MVILDLPIPGGFAIDPGELDELVGSQEIAKYQVTARQGDRLPARTAAESGRSNCGTA